MTRREIDSAHMHIIRHRIRQERRYNDLKLLLYVAVVASGFAVYTLLRELP